MLHKRSKAKSIIFSEDYRCRHHEDEKEGGARRILRAAIPQPVEERGSGSFIQQKLPGFRLHKTDKIQSGYFVDTTGQEPPVPYEKDNT
ncbi:MAG: hypothetical protein D3910_13780 [Candidatus Electrothrix sp. ATG2]|nr:hypothetical protein [Candidatus Electrothrix sp. ATG2]